MNWIQNHITDILAIGSYVIAITSIIVKVTPTPKDDAVLAKILNVIKLIALNKEKK